MSIVVLIEAAEEWERDEQVVRVCRAEVDQLRPVGPYVVVPVVPAVPVV